VASPPTRSERSRSCGPRPPKESTNFAEPTIEDYAERGAAQREFWTSQNGQQTGDPVKLAQALLTITAVQSPPRRFIAGASPH
jgi:hypothetical protein